jgi:hypothetical protein
MWLIVGFSPSLYTTSTKEMRCSASNARSLETEGCAGGQMDVSGLESLRTLDIWMLGGIKILELLHITKLFNIRHTL